MFNCIIYYSLLCANVIVQLLVIVGIWYIFSVVTGTPLLSNYWVAIIVIIFGYIF